MSVEMGEQVGVPPEPLVVAPEPTAVHVAAVVRPAAARPGNNSARLLRRWLLPVLLAVTMIGLLLLLGRTLMPFTVGLAMAPLLLPIMDQLVQAGAPKPLAAGLLAFLLMALIIGFLLLLPFVGMQLVGFASELDDWLRTTYSSAQVLLEQHLGPLEMPDSGQMAQSLTPSLELVQRSARNILLVGTTLLDWLFLILLTPFVTFYFLVDGRRIWRTVVRCFEPPHRETVRELGNEIVERLGDYLRGLAAMGLIEAIYHGVALWFIGLNFAILLGIAAGIAVAIPIIGNLTVFGVTMIIALIQFGFTWQVLAVMGVFATAQVLETTVLTPWLMGQQLNLHPLLVIFAMLAGGSLFGFWGMLLSIPVAGIIQVLFQHLPDDLVPRERR